MSGALIIQSWAPNTTCDPCKMAPKYYCSTFMGENWTEDFFFLSSVFTQPVLYLASGEIAGDPPGKPGAGAAGWPGYISIGDWHTPSTVELNQRGIHWDSFPSPSPLLIAQDGQPYDGIDHLGDLMQWRDTFDGGTPNQNWGYASLAGGFTWNEPGWFGDPAHTHTVGDGGEILDSDYIYYDASGNVSERPGAMYYCQKTRMWYRLVRGTSTGAWTYLYFNTTESYATFMTTAYDGYTRTDSGYQKQSGSITITMFVNLLQELPLRSIISH